MSTVRSLIEQHLEVLVTDIGARPPGSPPNRRATQYVRSVLDRCGFEVVEHPFATRWWNPGEGRLESSAGTVMVTPDPYSAPADVRAPTTHVADLDELEALEDGSDRILVLEGTLAREQLLPAAFPFLEFPEHNRVRAALTRLAPRAVIAVSDHWQPILEDPDLALPSTTVTTGLGVQLRPGEVVRLVLGGAVHHGHGTNVVGRTGGAGPRVVLSAHLDSKVTTPGAFDNAGAVACVLAAAATGLDAIGPCEVVPFNGEDHFDACGETAWLAATDLAEIRANINVDGVGVAGRGTALAPLACPPPLETTLEAWVARRAGWARSEPWYESDHAIFAMQGIPAVAITSEHVHELLGSLAHTAADTLDVLDLAVLEDVATALPDLVGLVHETLARTPAT